MCEPATIAFALMAVATVAEGYQAREQGKYQNDVSKYNAANMKNEAVHARNKGTEEENIHREKVQQMIARQRVQGAAQGVDIGSGSMLNLQQDTETLGDADALRIRSNFSNQADAIEKGAVLELSQGKAAEHAGDMAFKTSLLKAGGQAAMGVSSKWAADAAAKKAAAGATTTKAASSGFNQQLFNRNSAMLASSFGSQSR